MAAVALTLVLVVVVAVVVGDRSGSGNAGDDRTAVVTTGRGPSPTTATGPTASPVSGVTIAAVGDMVCAPGPVTTSTECRQKQVADLIVADATITQVLALGDLQYQSGELAAFQSSYDVPYGRFKAKTKPAPGNHEYETPGATGYYAYFGARAGRPDQGLLQLRRRHDVARRRAELELLGCVVRGRLSAGAVAARRPRREQPPVHDRVLAPPAVLLELGARRQRERRPVLGRAPAVRRRGARARRSRPRLRALRAADCRGRADAQGIPEFVVGTGGHSRSAFATPKANSVVRTVALRRAAARPRRRPTRGRWWPRAAQARQRHGHLPLSERVRPDPGHPLGLARPGGGRAAHPRGGRSLGAWLPSRLELNRPVGSASVSPRQSPNSSMRPSIDSDGERGSSLIDDPLSPLIAVGGTTVHGEGVDDQHVDQDHDRRPRRVVGQERELGSDGVAERGDETHDPPEGVPGEDEAAADEEEEAPREHDPAPRLQVVGERQLVTAADLREVRVVGDGDEPVGDVERTDHDDHEAGEHLPAHAAGLGVVDVVGGGHRRVVLPWSGAIDRMGRRAAVTRVRRGRCRDRRVR